MPTTEREIREKIPFITHITYMHTFIHMHVGINITKEMKYLDIETFKTLKKET